MSVQTWLAPPQENRQWQLIISPFCIRGFNWTKGQRGPTLKEDIKTPSKQEDQNLSNCDHYSFLTSLFPKMHRIKK